jgi:hypothetical protein
MSTGARHAFGLVAGLLLPPLIGAGLMYATGAVTTSMRNLTISWAGLGVFVLCGIATAFLVGSRLSPIASLLGGLEFTVAGLLPTADTLARLSLMPPPDRLGVLSAGYATLAYSGLMLFLGVMMLAASALPSRWRANRPVSFDPGQEPALPYAPGPEPYRPSYPRQGPEDATRPMHRE